MNGIQDIIRRFIQNTLGHKTSSAIGAVAGIILLDYNEAIASGLINVTGLSPVWAHRLTIFVGVLTFLAGLAHNPTATAQ